MRRHDLEHLIRDACVATKQDQVIVVGSQSVLGTYSEFELPRESIASEEADFFPLLDDSEESHSTMIDGTIGEMSQFHLKFGYYAQGVGRHTATLAPGWENRLVPVRTEFTGYKTGWCLDVHDLCSAKLIANREKDLRFVAALIEKDLVSVAVISDRIEATDHDVAQKEIAKAWIDGWDRNQPGYVAPVLPYVPDDLPEHPRHVMASGSWINNDPDTDRTGQN